jgi:methanogenic corrinoid protein MtbC1
MSEQLINAIADLKEKEAIGIVEEIVKSGLVESVVILDQLRIAMEIVGKRYEEGSYFLPELLMSGMIMNRIKEIVKDKIAGTVKTSFRGRVLIGTIEGDIHNIGKDIVSFMLDSNGFEVLDLGVNVPARKFVEAIGTFKPQVVGLSAFLTLAYDVMKKTIIEFENCGVRDTIKVMIGGGVIDERVQAYTGADGYGKNAMDAVKLTENWIGG